MMADSTRKTVLKPKRVVYTSTDEWCRGYYCAVAALLREEGSVTTTVRDLFKQGGNATQADPEDIELFKQHGLME